MRVPLIVLALVAMPLSAGAAQGNSGGNANANADNRCKNPAASTRQDGSHRNAPQANQKNCPAPVPPPAPAPPPAPPLGPHHVDGVVYEEVDGVPGFDMFTGEMGISNVPVELYWNGLLIDSKVSDANGRFSFPGLGITTYNVCVIGPAGYSQVLPSISDGAPCGGAGYVALFVSNIESGFKADFGFVLMP